MNAHPGATVVVRKSGFFSALVIGLFTFLTGAVVCGTAVAFYGLHIVDHRSGDVVETVKSVVEALPKWRSALPPAVSDALQDQRDPAYRSELEVTARVMPGRGRSDRPVVVIEITNNGTRTVSLMSARVTLEDENGVPLESFSTYLATPLAVGEGDGEWRGPLLPGSTRRVTVEDWSARGVARAGVEVNELRVWVAPPAAATGPAPQTALAAPGTDPP